MPTEAPLDEVLKPKSVAVIGASPNPGTYGERSVRHFNTLGFKGTVYCVNPRYQSVAGFDCYPSIADIPGTVDTAVITVARQHVPGAVRDLAGKNCRGAVVLSSGFSETGDATGRQLERELLEAAQTANIRLFGPNTNGVVNLVDNVPFGVSSVMDRTALLRGHTAVVSQSGSLGAALADQLMESGVGVSYVFGMGNALDIGMTDVLRFLARDAKTRVVLMFIEGLRAAAPFFSALEAIAATGRLPVILKVGQSAQGRLAAATHSGSIAGSWDAFRMLATESGAVVVDTPEDATAICVIAARRELNTPVPRIRVITMSGAICGLVADEAARVELPLVAPGGAAKAGLEDMGYRGPQNPLDFGELQRGATSPPDFKRACHLLLEEDESDALLVATGLTAQLPAMAKSLVELRSTFNKPIYGYVVGGSVAAPFASAIRVAGIPVFQDLRRAMQAIRFGASRAPREPQHDVAMVGLKPTSEQSAAFAVSVASSTEFNMANFLSSFGLRYPPSIIATSPAAAAMAATTIGYPVVVKAVGSKILHKAASGLVHLSLADDEAVKAAFEECRRNALDADLWEGTAAIQKMASTAGGLELMIAARLDPEVGPILVVAPGGLIVEALPSAAVAARLPHTSSDVERIVDRSAFLAKLFRQGRVALDYQAFVTAVLSFSAAARLGLTKFATIEVNPLVIMRRGSGCWALDASAVLGGTGLQ